MVVLNVLSKQIIRNLTPSVTIIIIFGKILIYLENFEVETLEVVPPNDPNEIISGFYDKEQLIEFFRRPHL